MYKPLLCWRYLRTRYIALASIISVTLGVATMIVVNSVMSGFTTQMQDRIHGILSDVVLEARSSKGIHDAQWHMEQIRRVAGDSIEGMTATVAVPAMLNFEFRGNEITRQVQLIGIEATTQSRVSDFGKYLQHPANRRAMSFNLREEGYDTRSHEAGAEAPARPQMEEAGWEHRRRVAREKRFLRLSQPDNQTEVLLQPEAVSKENRQAAAQNPPTPRTEIQILGASKPLRQTEEAQSTQTENADTAPAAPRPVDPFAARSTAEASLFDAAREQHTGLVLGIALASYRLSDGQERFLILPGDDVKLTLPTAGTPPKAVSDVFTIVDFYESKMSEYDASFVFVPIRKLQELRGMIEPSSGIGLFSSIQIKLVPGAEGAEVRDKLSRAFSPQLYSIQTWRDKQGPLLEAVHMETAILNVLLFLIIAVAGFGILAIFLMIVVEKTKDIGILKSLGASSGGIMGIFLSYGLSLGIVGSGAGMVLGLLFVRYINQVADLLGRFTGRPVFDPSVYYFHKIPTIVDPATVAWIVFGALAIAVLASILPALRAALLHPVEALRYE